MPTLHIHPQDSVDFLSGFGRRSQDPVNVLLVSPKGPFYKGPLSGTQDRTQQNKGISRLTDDCRRVSGPGGLKQ